MLVFWLHRGKVNSMKKLGLCLAIFLCLANIGYTQISPSVSIIAPSVIHSGEKVPIAVYFYLTNDQIDVDHTGTHELQIDAGTIVDSELKVFRGVGALSSVIIGSGTITLSVPGHAETKTIEVIDAPTRLTFQGILAMDQTWTAGRVYYIASNLTIPVGVELLIEEGSRILLAKDANILVQGKIRVLGSLNNPVIFTADIWGEQWGGIELLNDSEVSQFRYTIFTAGGGDSNRIFGHSSSQPVLKADHSTLDVLHCYFIYNYGKGMATDASVNLVSNCLIYRCDTGAEFRYSQTNISNTQVMFIPDEDGAADDNDNDGIYIWNTHPTISSPTVIEDCTIYATEDEGIDVNSQANLQVKGCFVSNVFDKGVSIGNQSDALLSRNIITHAQGAGIGSKDHSNVTVDNCTLYANKVGLMGYTKYVEQGGGNIVARNIIFYGQTDASVSEDSDSDVQVKYSISESNTISGLGNLMSNPMLANPSGQDFSLLTGSPAIDAGDPASPPDPDGTRSDMGAVPYAQQGGLDLSVTEISYFPMVQGVESKDLEFIEIFNPNGTTVNLSGYKFISGVEFTFPVGASIGSYSYIVVAGNSASYGSLGVPVFQWTSGSLSNTGERIAMEDDQGNLVLDITYGSQAPWPVPTSIHHYPIESLTTGIGYPQPGIWQLSYEYGGTPGRANERSKPTGLWINEFVAAAGPAYLDEFGNESDWLEIYNAGNKPVNLAGLFFTDHLNEPGYFQVGSADFDKTTVTAKGFIVFRADKMPELGVLHLDFQLASHGEEIGFSYEGSSGFEFLDQLIYDVQTMDVSTGRYPDGSANLVTFAFPTPGATNSVNQDVQISGLFINEFVAKFGTFYPDEFGNFSDWIEVYNSNDKAINMGGLYFTDHKAEPYFFMIPLDQPDKTTIPSKGFLVFRADKLPELGPLHLNFELASQAEEIGLYQNFHGNEVVIDELSYTVQTADISYGRVRDGDPTWQFFATPTPGASNHGASAIDWLSIGNDMRVNIYPNPVSVQIGIEITVLNPGDIVIQLFEPTGRVLDEIMVPAQTLNSGTQKISWPIKNSIKDQGLYFVRIRSSEEEIVKRIIINR